MAWRLLAVNIPIVVVYGLLHISQPAIARAQEQRAEELQAAVFVDRAVLAFGEKRYDAALKELQEALRLHPLSVDALYYQGLTYMALDRPAEARASLGKAREIRPNDMDVIFQLGVLDFSEREYDKAEPLLRQVHQAYGSSRDAVWQCYS
jgi:tetratricopeptide (TPR) repeat protein